MFWHYECNKRFVFDRFKSCIFEKWPKCGRILSVYSTVHLYMFDLAFFEIFCRFSDCVTAWLDDGFCDDENNKAACFYDEGDCCGPDVNLAYCSECKCKEESTQGPYQQGMDMVQSFSERHSIERRSKIRNERERNQNLLSASTNKRSFSCSKCCNFSEVIV